MTSFTGILIGTTSEESQIGIEPRMANRHGLIAGATGTGKTVTLQRLAEGFAKQGVSVFLADVKGDLSGLSQTGTPGAKILERIQKIKLEGFQPRATPTVFWDVYGQKGHALRTTISEMGPLLLGRLLDLNDTQEGTLQVLFRIADDQGLLLLDLKDLQALIGWAGDNAKDLKDEYGILSSATLGTIQRKLLVLGESGGAVFFGEPAIKLEHILQRDFSGNGVVSILDASHLMNDPRVYTSFMLWLLSELFEALPEVGDQDKPKLVFFFDEAHLLFQDAPKILLERIERVVRLVRSKGVGVYFVTQNPMDVPETVLGQLGNRIQHALRAFTPLDQKAVKVAAQTFRQNPKFDTEEVITQLAVGEALVSVLDAEGRPTVVERTLVAPPESRIGPAADTERADVISRSPLKGIYEQILDRESAFELLKQKETRAEAAATRPEPSPRPEMSGPFSGPSSNSSGPFSRPAPAPRPSNRQGVGEAFMKSAVRSIGASLGRQILRGVLGSILR